LTQTPKLKVTKIKGFTVFPGHTLWQTPTAVLTGFFHAFAHGHLSQELRHTRNMSYVLLYCTVAYCKCWHWL